LNLCFLKLLTYKILTFFDILFESFSFFRRRKSCLRGPARHRASTKPFGSPRQWGARPRFRRPPARPFPRIKCSLRVRNPRVSFARYKMLISRYIITVFVYCNRFSGPTGVSVHVEFDSSHSILRSRLRPWTRSSKYYLILYPIKIYFFLHVIPTPLSSQDRLSLGHSGHPQCKVFPQFLYSIY